MVECHLAKVDVEGSSPFSRSTSFRLQFLVVGREVALSARAALRGSITTVITTGPNEVGDGGNGGSLLVHRDAGENAP